MLLHGVTGHARPAAARARGGDGAQADLGLAAAGDAVQEHRRRALLGQRPLDGRDGLGLRRGRVVRGVARRGLGEGGALGRVALLELHHPQLGQLLGRGAGVAPPALEARDRRAAHRAQMREHLRRLAAQRAGGLHLRRGDGPLHAPRADPGRRREQVGLGELGRGVALDWRQRQSHDLADRREVVPGQIAQER
jgi:hypothetical protein